MKYLLALLPLICFAGEPSQSAGFANNAGGWTVITTRDHYCGSKDMHDGYAFGTNAYIRFCWTRRSNAVMVVFEDGATGTWHIDSFELLDSEPEYKGNKS